MAELLTGEVQQTRSKCPFHGMFSAPEIFAHSTPESSGRLPLSSALMRRFQEFGVYIAEGVSGFTGFDLSKHADERIVPMVPLDVDLIKKGARLFVNPFGVLKDLFTSYGPDCQLHLPTGHRFIFTADQEIMDHVFKNTDSKEKIYAKGISMVKAATPIFGASNIVTGSGDAWRSRRSAMSAHFGRSQFEEASVVFTIDSAVERCVTELQGRIEEAGGQLQIDLQEEIAATTLNVFLSCFFHIDEFSNQDLKPLYHALETLLDSIPAEGMNFLPLSFVAMDEIFPPLSNLAEAKQVFEGFIEKIIDIGKARTEPKGDLLDVLLAAKDVTTGEPLDRATLVEEFKTLVVAGHETTGKTLAFCMGSVLLNSSEYERICAEIKGMSGKEILKSSELSKEFPAISENQSEALRMYPALYALPRVALKEDLIETKQGSIHIRPGTTVMVSPFFMQRREELFGKEVCGFAADEYAPQRWQSKNIDSRSLASFGSGARACIGQHFFNPEFILVMRRYLESFKFEPLYQDIDSRLSGTFGLKCDGGLKVLVS